MIKIISTGKLPSAKCRSCQTVVSYSKGDVINGSLMRHIKCPLCGYNIKVPIIPIRGY